MKLIIALTALLALAACEGDSHGNVRFNPAMSFTIDATDGTL